MQAAAKQVGAFHADGRRTHNYRHPLLCEHKKQVLIHIREAEASYVDMIESSGPMAKDPWKLLHGKSQSKLFVIIF